MKQVALFGGSFNPPHVGHEAILRWLGSSDSPVAFDAIWALPVMTHAFDKDLLPYGTRGLMVKAMSSDLPKVKVVRRDEKYAAEMLEALHAEHPDTRFRMVLGADIWHERSKWHRWDTVCRLAPLLFVSRRGVAIPTEITVHFIDAPEVSSTELRSGLAAGKVMTEMIPESVLRFIEDQKLYLS